MPDCFPSVLNRLQAELNQASPARAILQENNRKPIRGIQEEKIRREPFLRRAIDDACKLWIDGGSWPKMDSETGILIWERLNQGFLLGVYLHTKGGLTAAQKTESDLLSFLLIDTWEVIGLHRFQAQLKNIQ